MEEISNLEIKPRFTEPGAIEDYFSNVLHVDLQTYCEYIIRIAQGKFANGLQLFECNQDVFESLKEEQGHNFRKIDERDLYDDGKIFMFFNLHESEYDYYNANIDIFNKGTLLSNCPSSFVLRVKVRNYKLGFFD